MTLAKSVTEQLAYFDNLIEEPGAAVFLFCF
jgi:hypothetical protein